MELVHAAPYKMCKTDSSYRHKIVLEPTEITEDILIEILIRLPINSIAILKSVSKKWNNFISHNYCFHTCYKDACKRILMLLGLFYQNNYTGENELGFLPATDQGNMLESLTFVVEATSNGFLLCRCEGDCLNYFIYNPITKETLPLPPAPPVPNNTASYHKTGFICQGNFSRPLHYKVVRFIVDGTITNTLTIDILSLDEGKKWKKLNLTCSSSFLINHNFSSIITEAGLVYWPVNTAVGFLRGVIVFDHRQEHSLLLEMSVLPREAGKGLGRSRINYFGHTNGLIVYAIYNDRCLEMWVLDEHNNKWYRKYKVSNLNIRMKRLTDLRALHPLHPHVLFLNTEDEKVVWYNVKTRTEHSVSDLHEYHRILPYVCPVNWVW